MRERSVSVVTTSHVACTNCKQRLKRRRQQLPRGATQQFNLGARKAGGAGAGARAELGSRGRMQHPHEPARNRR
jgi:hypothetical protein